MRNDEEKFLIINYHFLSWIRIRIPDSWQIQQANLTWIRADPSPEHYRLKLPNTWLFENIEKTMQ